MQHLDDKELLRRCGTHRSEEALSVLINRHLDLVYSSALRQVRDPHLAKDVAQSVFLLLAKKARSLKPGTILTGWLFRSTRFIASETVRSENRRRAREHAAMQPTEADDTNRWQEIEPLLDEVIAELTDPERDAILLRFFEKRSLRDVGQRFGISEDAAQKRVTRALDKLRGLLTERGPTISTATLGTLLPACAVQAAPAGLAATILTAAAPSAVAATAFGIQTIIESITMTKLKAAAVASVLAAAVSIPVANQHRTLKTTRQENEKLRAELQQYQANPVSMAETESGVHSIPALELARLRRDAAEVHRLRAEVTQLRSGSYGPGLASGSGIPAEIDPAFTEDPMERMNLGRDLVKQGRYAEALAHFLWCFDEGGKNPGIGFGAVRLSFLLGDLQALAKVYPPAQEAMLARRDASEEQILNRAADASDIREYHRLNEHLNQPAQTLSLFDQLPSGHDARALLVDTALDQFVYSRRYSDIVEAGNPEANFDSARFSYDHYRNSEEADHRESGVTSLLRRAVETGAAGLEALAGAGQVNRAIALADAVLAVDSSPETRGQLLKHAQRAGAASVIAHLQNTR